MGKVSFLLLAFAASVLEQSAGWNYFWQTNPLPQDLISYPYLSPISPIWQPDCDKNKESSESSSSESSDSKEDSSSSSESDSKEKKESKESKESGEAKSEDSKESKEGSKESKEGSKESKEGSKESKESKESEESKDSKESKSSGESSEDSKEKKKESSKKKKKKKESKSLFPPRIYNFPPRPLQRIIYSPASYLPYKPSYIVQQPITSYPVKSAYQYIPGSRTVVRSFSTSPVVGQLFNSPTQKIVYSPAPVLNYAPVSKSVYSRASVISVPGSWNNPADLFKK